MLKTTWMAVAMLSLSVLAHAQGPNRVALGDWPELRGPHRDGTSKETGLPETWALNGENFLWRAPFGGRATPIVVGDRVFVQNAAGRDAEMQERVMALGDLGVQVQQLPERRPDASYGMGLTCRRSRNRQRVRHGQWRDGDGAQPRRRAPLAPIDRRRVRRLYHPRWPHRVSCDRRRSRHRACCRLQLG